MVLEQIFFPRHKKFFGLFNELTAGLAEMSALLKITSTGNCSIGDCLYQMSEMEKKAEAVVHTLFVELSVNLITPFDREDIHYLTSGLKSVCGNVLHIVRQGVTYNMPLTGVHTTYVAAQFQQAITILSLVVAHLSKPKALLKLGADCSKIHELLYNCDERMDIAISELLNAAGSDPLTVIKSMDHFNALERLVARAGDTVNVIESIIVKYA